MLWLPDAGSQVGVVSFESFFVLSILVFLPSEFAVADSDIAGETFVVLPRDFLKAIFKF